jgi:hypothetical protein
MFAPSMLLVYAGLLLFISFMFIASVGLLCWWLLSRKRANSEAAHSTAIMAGIDWRDGLNDDEIEIMRSRANRLASEQLERTAVDKFRQLIQ